MTNVATPYREPLWRALAEQLTLTVALLADTEGYHEWNVDLSDVPYEVVHLRARRLTTSGGSAIYAPSLRALRLVSARPAAVVLDGWESPAFLAARWWARRMRVPVIASYRSTLATHRFDHGIIAALRRWFFGGADRVLTAGQASTEAVLAMGIDRGTIVEGFNTVDVSRFLDGARAARRELLPRPGHHTIYVGQFIPRKNVHSVIEAFALSRAEHDTLTLVGSGPDEPELRRLAARLEVDGDVSFPGYLEGDDLVRAYAAATTSVLASTEEVWGLVVNEGLAAGLHAVVSERCGVAQSIADMPGVFLCPPTVEGIAQALTRSRDQWRGHLEDHPITRHTPHELARVVIEAMR